jgi:hypothetical protein
MNNKLPLIIALSILFIGIIGALASITARQIKKNQIQSFDECAAAGYPIQESYPERCTVPGGKSFDRIVTGQQITVTGEITCLPHKNKGDIQTLECAFGIKTAANQYYALSDPTMQFIMDLPMGKQTTIIGTIQSDQQYSPSIYDTIGTILVTAVEPSLE